MATPKNSDDELLESIRGTWHAAREISGNPSGEWTFPLMLHRALALERAGRRPLRGLNLVYESLSSWDELAGILRMNQVLFDHDVDSRWLWQAGVGMEVFRSMYGAPTGRLSLPTSRREFRGRHAVRVLEITDDGDLLFANSWGMDWGDGGLGYMPREYFEEHVREVWVTRASFVGLSPAMDRQLGRKLWMEARPRWPLPSEMAEHWMTPNPIQIRNSPDRRDVQLRMRRVFSSRADVSGLDVVELRQSGRPLGRLQVRHPRDVDVSLVEELFVDPAERRRGLGSLLASEARDLAFQQDRGSLEALIHEADGDDRSLRAAQSFLSHHGYRLKDVQEVRPAVTGRAIRAIGGL